MKASLRKTCLGWTYGALNYFDVVRTNHDPYQLADDVIRRCTVKPRGGGFGARPQHCSAPACAPDIDTSVYN